MTKMLHWLKNDTASRVKKFLYGLIRSSFDDVQVATMTERDVGRVGDEALTSLPVDVVER